MLFFFFENLNWTSQNLQCCSPVLSPFYFTIYSTFFSSSHVRKICSTRFGSSAVYSQHALHCCLYLTETQLVGHPFLCMVEFQGGLVWNWANCSFVSWKWGLIVAWEATSSSGLLHDRCRAWCSSTLRQGFYCISFLLCYLRGGRSVTGAALTDGGDELTSHRLFTVQSVSQEGGCLDSHPLYFTLFHSVL